MSLTILNPDAQTVSRVAHELTQGYYTYLTLLEIAANPKSNSLIPSVLPGQLVSIGVVPDRNNTATHQFDFEFYLESAVSAI